MGRNLGSRRRRKKAFHFLQRSLSLTFRPPDFCAHCSEKPLLRSLPLYSVCCPPLFDLGANSFHGMGRNVFALLHLDAERAARDPSNSIGAETNVCLSVVSLLSRSVGRSHVASSGVSLLRSRDGKIVSVCVMHRPLCA